MKRSSMKTSERGASSMQGGRSVASAVAKRMEELHRSLEQCLVRVAMDIRVLSRVMD